MTDWAVQSVIFRLKTLFKEYRKHLRNLCEHNPQNQRNVP